MDDDTRCWVCQGPATSRRLPSNPPWGFTLSGAVRTELDYLRAVAPDHPGQLFACDEHKVWRILDPDDPTNAVPVERTTSSPRPNWVTRQNQHRHQLREQLMAQLGGKCEV